jgi:hypothetical protein
MGFIPILPNNPWPYSGPFSPLCVQTRRYADRSANTRRHLRVDRAGRGAVRSFEKFADAIHEYGVVGCEDIIGSLPLSVFITQIRKQRKLTRSSDFMQSPERRAGKRAIKSQTAGRKNLSSVWDWPNLSWSSALEHQWEVVSPHRRL